MQNIPPPELVIVSTKGQIVIPREIRELAGLAAGSKLVIQLREDGVLEIRLAKGGIEDLFGIVRKLQNAPQKVSLTKNQEEDAIMAMVAKEDQKTKKSGET